MFKRLCIAFSLLAVFAANGGYLFCVQALAWGEMLADYSRFMPAGVAVQKILAGEEVCSLCEWVDGQQQEIEEQVMLHDSKHPLLSCSECKPTLLKPPLTRWGICTVAVPVRRVAELSTPPPRVSG